MDKLKSDPKKTLIWSAIETKRHQERMQWDLQNNEEDFNIPIVFLRFNLKVFPIASLIAHRALL